MRVLRRLGPPELARLAAVSAACLAEAAAVGRPDELKGQALVVFVTVKSGITPSEALKEELRNHVGKEIGSIAKPDAVRLAAEGEPGRGQAKPGYL